MKLLVPGIVLATALVVAGCTTNPFNPPPPGDAPGAYPSAGASLTPAPAGAVSEADLPIAEDLVWNETRWIAGETGSGSGIEQVSVCQQNRMEALGPNALWMRTFHLDGSDSNTAAAVVMSFESNDLADQAYSTLQEWTANCTGTLETQGRTDARQTIPAHPITVSDGRAQFTEWTYGIGPNMGEFESQGLYQVDDRIGLLIMRTQGQDNNWDLESGGPVGMLHPQIRSLPAAAARLAV